MAWTFSDNWGRFPGCNGSWGDCIATYWMDWSNWSFTRDTSNCEYAWVYCDVKMRCSGNNLGWSTPSGIIREATQCDYWDGNSGVYDWTAGKGGQCHSSFSYGTPTHRTKGHVKAGVSTLGFWWIWGFTPTSTGNDWQWLQKHEYSLSNSMKVLPPTGLSVSWPTTLGGTTSASISSWSSNPNIGGTPTSYPNAKYWNWALDLLDTSGNYLAHKPLNRGETKSASWSGDYNFYTASSLTPSGYYTVEKNKGYKLKVVVNNSFNQQLNSTSSTIYTAPPTPTVSITSCVYNPASKDVQLTFSWSKAKDGGAYTETIKYDLYDATGKYYKSGEVLATVSGGTAKSGTQTITGLPSGEQYTVKVTVSTTKGSASKSASTYAPVANAAFLGFDWDDVRRTCTIRAEAPGAANCRIQAGYAANNYNIGNKLTTGEIGTLVVKDLQHGSGQIMYLQAVPEASDGHQYTNEIAKISVPIPNPILGVVTPGCDSGQEQQYIVDIVEKKADCSLTPKWQVGDRVVTKDDCGPGGGIVGVYDFQHSICYDIATNGAATVKAGSWFSFKMSEALAAAVTDPLVLTNNTNAANWIKKCEVKRDGDLVAWTQKQDYTITGSAGIMIKSGGQILWSFGFRMAAGMLWRNNDYSANVKKYYYQKDGQWITGPDPTRYPYGEQNDTLDLPQGDIPLTCS